MSVVSRMALQHRYMPTLARMVVMSQVPRAATTLGRAAITSSRVMITSVWSAPMNCAAFRAYFRSMASVSMPIAKVRIGFPSSRAAMAHTSELSRPPLSRNPSGASASSRFSTPAVSRSCSPRQTVSSSAIRY